MSPAFLSLLCIGVLTISWVFFIHRKCREHLFVAVAGVLVSTGGCLNFLVKSQNQWKMPVAPLNASDAFSIAASEQWRVMDGETHLNILGDWIYLGFVTLSIGDILMALGMTLYTLAYLLTLFPGVFGSLLCKYKKEQTLRPAS